MPIKMISLAGVAREMTEARAIANRKLDELYAEFGSRVRETNHIPLRERYADRGFVCFLIKAEVELSYADLALLKSKMEIVAELERMGDFSVIIPGSVN